MVAVRGFWRASTADSWTTAGINGLHAYIGSQVELRMRWQIRPDNLLLEGGFTHLFAGDLMNQVGKTDVTYVYTQIGIKF